MPDDNPDMDMSEVNARVTKFMDEQVPFNKFLGIHLLEIGGGRAVMELPFRDELIGDPFRPAMHGGAMSTLVDTCGGAAVWCAARPSDRVSTVDLRVDYLRPGPLEDLICEAVVVRIGNHVGATSMKVWARSNPDRIITTGSGVYNVRRARA